MQSTAGGPLLGVNETISVKTKPPTIRTKDPWLPSNVRQQEKEQFIGKIKQCNFLFFLFM